MVVLIWLAYFEGGVVVSLLNALHRMTDSQSIRKPEPYIKVATDWMVNYIIPNLNPMLDEKQPKTFTQYRTTASMNIQLGGMGEGLDCSLPNSRLVAPVLTRLFTSAGNFSPIASRFRQACVMHDFCYRHGAATYGFVQDDCDRNLQEDSFRLCRMVFDTSKHPGTDIFRSCETDAKKILLAVKLGGGQNFRATENSTFFEYDPAPKLSGTRYFAREVSDAQNFGQLDNTVVFGLSENAIDWHWLRASSGEGNKLRFSEAQPFPHLRQSTPPTLLTTKSGTSLWSLSRNWTESHNAMLHQWEIKANSKGAPALMFTLPSPWVRGNQYASSVMQLTDIDEIASVMALSNAGVRIKDGYAPVFRNFEPNYRLLKSIGQWKFSATFSGNKEEKEKEPTHDNYRFLQHPPYFVRDTPSQEFLAYTFSRGQDTEGEALKTNGPAIGFESTTVIGRGRQYPKGPSYVKINADQTHEPFQMLSTSGLPQAFLSARKAKNANGQFANELPAEFTAWRVTPNSPDKPFRLETQENIVPAQRINGRLLEIPPVLLVDAASSSNVMLFSDIRLDLAGNADGASSAGNTSIVEFEWDVRNLAFSETSKQFSIEYLGKFSCELNQEAMRDRILKLETLGDERLEMKRHTLGCYGGSQNTGKCQYFEILKTHGELYKRWRQSQILPRLVKHPGTNNFDLNIQVVFNGYPEETLTATAKFSSKDNKPVVAAMQGNHKLTCEVR
jgi:hypothetical protein